MKRSLGDRRFDGCASLADCLQRLPLELLRAVMRRAGLLTQWLHGELAQPMSLVTVQRLVAECIRDDRVAVVRRLPLIRLSFELLLVRSEEMRAGVRRFPRGLPGSGGGMVSEHAGGGGRAGGGGAAAGDEPWAAATMPGPGGRPAGADDAEWSRGVGLGRGTDAEALEPFLKLVVEDLVPELVGLANDVLDWAMTQLTRPYRRGVPSTLLVCAAGLGRTDVAEALLPYVAIVPETAFDSAGRIGHLGMLRLLCENSKPKRVSIDGAVEGGQFEAVRYLRERYPRIVPSHLGIESALREGQHAMVWSLLRDESLWRAHEEVLADLNEAFLMFRCLCMAHGTPEMLDYAVEHGIGGQMWYRAMDRAAQTGRLANLQWLHERGGYGCTVRAMDTAAEQGHLEVAQWLHANRTEGCTPDALRWAAEAGHLEMFKWLWETFPGKRPSVEDMCTPVARGHFWIVEFFMLHTEGDLTPLLESALGSERLLIADWLVDHGRATPTAEMMDWIAYRGSLPCARWLYSRVSVPPSPIAIAKACLIGSVDMLSFLVDECGAEVADRAFELALRMHHHEIVAYLAAKFPDRWTDELAGEENGAAAAASRPGSSVDLDDLQELWGDLVDDESLESDSRVILAFLPTDSDNDGTGSAAAASGDAGAEDNAVLGDFFPDGLDTAFEFDGAQGMFFDLVDWSDDEEHLAIQDEAPALSSLGQ
ncbi:hypothetical protein HK105_206624 [Polyrhizophydium stewartii]|uniref:Ankyrin repeat protein n=1 Tax=Polyrhizophydium stewartii TaxID=2732419 RepID=A0ABR4N2Z9_9FUNG|nr:hypothetical protein HK105_007512 [Polyrhizophydium stewartii]